MSNQTDSFTQKLFNYGSLTLFATVGEETARLQLNDGSAYTMPLVATLKKDAAFIIYNNSSVNTYDEMRKQLFSLGAK